MMTEEVFAARLEEELSGVGEAGGVDAAMALGRRRLGRRRVAVAFSAFAAVAIVGAGFTMLPRSAPAEPVPATQTQQESEGWLRECRESPAISPAAKQGLFGKGMPTIKASAQARRATYVVIESADGNVWGTCTINRPEFNPEFSSSVSAYDSRSRSRNFGWSSNHHGCDTTDATPCRAELMIADRLPPQVANVELSTKDGTIVNEPTREGYLLLVHEAEVDNESDELIKRIEYQDARGHGLAAQAMDGSGTGVDGERIGTLPLLKAYPSHRGDEI